mmetsp:Transcript_9286/g.13989  ORF Transcript_9286/g.13989 Transcript_9286/m.13989 type:complete len:215 (-) Transcript_9286:249-893(-)|eukprot:CAMPEP_0185025474 /NCGR_PEP_ID=MMETSP1103-20130426/8417_1 /TAXON_ID=36769 /ORGANISM="Paraphysomonas bandaiensis, Strain Caron Lab Isolate" /LENGTH=214 /DNA_ID=CAMNT_0027558677 /DNA_START=70 /DNA_END=714 /DNA_ORIENTATION=-
MEKGEKGEKGSDEERVETRPRRPRRPRQGGADEDEEYNKPAESKISEPAYTEPQAKPRRRRQVEESNDTAGDGGWMGGMAPDNKQKFEPEQETPDVMTTQNKDKHFNDDDAEIVIPDLDEDGGGDTDQRVAHAPRNVSRKIPPLSSLQHEAKTFLQTNKDGIDLSILLGTLVPSNMLVEDDSLWTFDSLLREVTEELHSMAKEQAATTKSAPKA